MIAEVKIKDLRMRTIIGINDWEREQKQDVVITLSYKYDATKAIETDDINYAVDYKTLTKKIISEIENSKFNLMEKLTHRVYSIIAEDKNIFDIDVLIEKPGALRFADNVMIKIKSEK